jgi:hypothetical protein
VFGTLAMHSPKVPHPDFSVQVVRHNLKIFAVEKFECSGLGRGIGVFPFSHSIRGNTPLKPKSA